MISQRNPEKVDSKEDGRDECECDDDVDQNVRNVLCKLVRCVSEYSGYSHTGTDLEQDVVDL
ncbi:hypothetical protein U1Q18_051823, partial [Sarracenia purpurea var. burkii]